MFWSAQLRKDPQEKTKGICPNGGFTIIETMVVLAVLAIIISLALPSYRMILEKRAVTSAAEQLAAFLSTAQIEAVKRNENIIVSYSRTDSDTWCLGLTSGVTACDCTLSNPTESDACVIDSHIRVLTDSNLNYPKIMNGMQGDGAFVYDPVRGLMVDHNDAATLELLSSQSRYSLNVQVNVTGRLRICSRTSDTQVPGYGVC